MLSINFFTITSVGSQILNFDKFKNFSSLRLNIEQNANIALQTAQYGYVMETGSIALKDTAGNLIRNDYVRRVYLGAD